MPENTVRYGPKTVRIDTVLYRKYAVFKTFTVRIHTVNVTVFIHLGSTASVKKCLLLVAAPEVGSGHPENFLKQLKQGLVAASETGWGGLSPPERKFLAPPLLVTTVKSFIATPKISWLARH